MNNTTTFAPGRYLVDAPYMNLHEAGPAGSPVGRWHFHVDLREDGSGVWTNLDGRVVYSFVAGETVEFLEGSVREGKKIDFVA
jgi:hypothetical protein